MRQQIGVIVSIVWLLTAPIFAWDVYTDYGQQRVEIALMKCELERVTGPRPTVASAECGQKVQEAYARAYKMMWVKLIVIAIAPVALGWLGPLLFRRRGSRTNNSAQRTEERPRS